MNIVQTQNDLKDLSDKQLQTQLLNPDGSVPSFLVLSELQRRKDMRDSYEQKKASGTSMAEEFSKGLGAAKVGNYSEALRGAMPGATPPQQPMGQPPMQMAQAPMQGAMPQGPQPQPMPEQGYADGGAVMAPSAQNAQSAQSAQSAPGSDGVSTWVDYLEGKKGPLGMLAGPAVPVIGAIAEGRSVGDILTTASPALTAMKSLGVKFADGGLVAGDTDRDNQPDVEADRSMMVGMPHDGGPAYAAGGGIFSMGRNPMEVLNAFGNPLGSRAAEYINPSPMQTLAAGLAAGAGGQPSSLMSQITGNREMPGSGLPSASAAPSGPMAPGASSPMGVLAAMGGSADGATGDGSGNGGDAGGVGAGVGTGVGDAAASAAAAAADAASNSDAGAAGMARGGMVRGYRTGGGIKAFQVGGGTGDDAGDAYWAPYSAWFTGMPTATVRPGRPGPTPSVRGGPSPTPMAYQRSGIYGPAPEGGYTYPNNPVADAAREAQERIGIESPTTILPNARGDMPTGRDMRLPPPTLPPPVGGAELKQWSFPPYTGFPGASSRQQDTSPGAPSPYQDPGGPDGTLPPGQGIPSAATPPGAPAGRPDGGATPTGTRPVADRTGGASGGASSGLNIGGEGLAEYMNQIRALGMPDRFGEMEARNREDRDKLLAGVEGQKGEALLTAGLAVMGGESPFAAVNFSRAREGIKQWNDSQKEMRAAQQAIRQAENQITIARANRDEKQLESGMKLYATAQEAKQRSLDRANAAGIAAAGRADALRLKEMELKDSSLNRAELREQHEIDSYLKSATGLDAKIQDASIKLGVAQSNVMAGEPGAKEALDAAKAQLARLQQQSVAAQSLYQRAILERTARRNQSSLISSEEEYKALKSGDRYLDARDGTIKIKK